MPVDSALRRELTGDWTQSDEMAALGLELTHQHYRATLAAAGVKRGRLPNPLRIPRPQPWQPPAPGGSTRPPRQGRRHATTPEDVIAVLSTAFGPARR